MPPRLLLQHHQGGFTPVTLDAKRARQLTGGALRFQSFTRPLDRIEVSGRGLDRSDARKQREAAKVRAIAGLLSRLRL
jgi:hypothetical protein